MLKKLAISKSGYIEVGLVRDDRNQCLERGVRELDYHVEIQGDPAKLDAQGFIYDRHKIPDYFDQKYRRRVDVLPSCEEMSRQAAEDLAALVGPVALRIVCSVGGAVAVWERDSDLTS